MIRRPEPPVLHIRIRRVTVFPAATSPKSMIKDGSQPPSLVSTSSTAFGAVLALPVMRIFWSPPVVQICNMFWYEPGSSALNLTGTVKDSPAARTFPTGGRSSDVKYSPTTLGIPNVTFSYTTGGSRSSTYPYPSIFRGCLPTLAMMNELSRPVAAPVPSARK